MGLAHAPLARDRSALRALRACSLWTAQLSPHSPPACSVTLRDTLTYVRGVRPVQKNEEKCTAFGDQRSLRQACVENIDADSPAVRGTRHSRDDCRIRRKVSLSCTALAIAPHSVLFGSLGSQTGWMKAVTTVREGWRATCQGRRDVTIRPGSDRSQIQSLCAPPVACAVPPRIGSGTRDVASCPWSRSPSVPSVPVVSFPEPAKRGIELTPLVKLGRREFSDRGILGDDRKSMLCSTV